MLSMYLTLAAVDLNAKDKVTATPRYQAAPINRITMLRECPGSLARERNTASANQTIRGP